MLGSTQPTTISQSQMVINDSSGLNEMYFSMFGINVPIMPMLVVGGLIAVWFVSKGGKRRRR